MTTRRKQQQQMVQRAMLAEEDRRRAARMNFRMLTVPVCSQASTELALLHTNADDHEDGTKVLAFCSDLVVDDTYLVYHTAKAGSCDRYRLSVVLLFCEQDNSRMRLRMSTKHGRHGLVKEWPSPKWLNFGDDLDPGMDSGSLFHVSHHCGIWDFRFLSISHIVTSWFFMKLGEMIDADKIMNPQHLGAIRQTSGSGYRSVQKSEFESWITFGWHFSVVWVYALWARLVSCTPTADINRFFFCS